LEQNLVDELIWIRSKKIIGEDGISAIGKLNFNKISEVINNFSKKRIQNLEEDIIETYSKT
jgi:riboflavin biosynthesis pyrimidine reductase